MELTCITKSANKIKVLNELGIHDVKDLLVHYPFRYVDNVVMNFDDFKVGDKVFFEATLASGFKTNYYAKNRSVTRFDVVYDEELIQVSIFNRPYLKVSSEEKIVISGKYEGKNKVVATTVNFKSVDEQVGIFPVYNLKEGITQNEMSKYVKKALKLMEGKIVDVIPDTYLRKYKLINKEKAINEIHFPTNRDTLKAALYYLKYEEFLKFNVTMMLLKKANVNVVSKSGKCFEMSKINEVISSLPYELSDDQKQVLTDIFDDLKANRLMYRLVQGDVGSGKTIVAILAMYAVALANQQSVIMAPTEILAKQHYDNIVKLLPEVEVVMLSGSLKKAERLSVLEQIASNKAKIIVGTHALFQEGVNYYNLGLVVTDEQHRFGVEQRKKLKDKGESVDVLMMSATPIPRTLALSLYGDMDVSSIHQMPSGRKAIQTTLIKQNSFTSVFDDIIELLQQGNQMYVITAMIEENEDFNKIKHAEGIYEALKKVLAMYAKVGLLHGKMSGEEKEQVMKQFADNEIQVLVSTTVVEVGVNVPNANIMVIYDSDRFGLSQLHQLRGRVGRGNRQGYCYLLTGSKDSDSLKRLEVLTKTTDGFEIARQDLLLRGAGDILGKRQSGVSGFVLGDIILDTSILELAREDAQMIVDHFDDDENKMIKTWVMLYQRNNISYVD